MSGMPSYNCKICGERTTYPAVDESFHANNYWECPLCFSLIATGRYEKNIKNGTTLFSPMGDALGDRIIQEVVRHQYEKENPDENIIYLGLSDPYKAKERYNPDKFFWADVTNFVQYPPGIATWFSLCNEAEAYARKGIYPQLDFIPKPVENIPSKFVVLHARYITKAPVKNAESFIINRILWMIYKDLRDKIEKIVLLGNDETDPAVTFDPDLCIDLRFKLRLPEIAWLCEHAQLVIGKDSGIIHLAAAAGAKIVAWGYTSPRWKPKTAPEKYIAFDNQNSQPKAIEEAIIKMLER